MTYTYLTKEELAAIELPKWPGCDVDGDSVTSEQAMEILVRTNGTYFSTNDREFGKDVRNIFYSTIPKPEWDEQWWGETYFSYSPDETPEQRMEKWSRNAQYSKEMGMLNLDYLINSRVCSSYIGGPHGWCDWNGNIFQRGVNIGKWPSTQEVYEEWEQIAEAFPFLRLTCRLLTHEAGYSDGNPGIAVVYEIENGKVKVRLPIETEISLISSDDDNDIEALVQRFNNPRAERGVSLAKWKKACDLVAQKQLTTVI